MKKKSIWPSAAFKDVDNTIDVLNKKEKMNSQQAYINYGNATLSQYDLICTSQPQECYPTPPVPCAIKGNNPMYVDNDKHIESSKINYLSDRASQVYYVKANGLSKTFGFGPYDAPETIQEFIDRIVAGKFTIKDLTKKDVKNFYYRQMEGITWKDPSVKEDQVGYDAALAALATLYQDTKDDIAVKIPVEALASVKALEAWTPTA